MLKLNNWYKSKITGKKYRFTQFDMGVPKPIFIKGEWISLEKFLNIYQ